MLQISKAQFKVFEEEARVRLHPRILEFLKQQLPAHLQSRDDAGWLKWIAGCDQAAAKYGITTAGAVTQFVVLSLLTGKDFHLGPAANRFLMHPELDGDQKMRLLTNMIAAPKGR